MDILLNNRNDLANGVRDGAHGEQFIGPNWKQVEGGEEKASLKT
jgi:hypothetical protein